MQMGLYGLKVSTVIGLDLLVPLVNKLRPSGLSSTWPRLMTAPKAGFQASYPPPWLSSLMLASDHTLTRTPSLAVLAGAIDTWLLWPKILLQLLHPDPHMCTCTQTVESPSPR